MTIAAQSIAQESLEAAISEKPLPAVICFMIWCVLSASLWSLILAGAAMFA
jgi:hypothetical protein